MVMMMLMKQRQRRLRILCRENVFFIAISLLFLGSPQVDGGSVTSFPALLPYNESSSSPRQKNNNHVWWPDAGGSDDEGEDELESSSDFEESWWQTNAQQQQQQPRDAGRRVAAGSSESDISPRRVTEESAESSAKVSSENASQAESTSRDSSSKEAKTIDHQESQTIPRPQSSDASESATSNTQATSSQPLQTLQKLQQMLDDTDYRTTTTGRTAQRNIQQPPPLKQESVVNVTHPVSAPDKLWTSKDRAKYKRQQIRLRREQQEESMRQTSSEQQQQQQTSIEQAKVGKLQSPPIQQYSSDDELSDTDDGLGYTLPNLPVYYSDAEGESEAEPEPTPDMERQVVLPESSSSHAAALSASSGFPPGAVYPYPPPPPPGYYPQQYTPSEQYSPPQQYPPYYPLPPNSYPYPPYGYYAPPQQQQQQQVYPGQFGPWDLTGFVPQPYAYPQQALPYRRPAETSPAPEPRLHNMDEQKEPPKQPQIVATQPLDMTRLVAPTRTENPQSLAEASSKVNFDSIQKSSLMLVTTALACYSAVSPRNLPLTEYNLGFYENLRIVSLATIAPAVYMLSVFDVRENDVNTLVNTFFTSFTVGYPLAFVVEIIVTTLVRLAVFCWFEANIFSLTPQVPVPIVPWVLRENRYRPKRITLFAADFGTSCVAAPIIEEYVKLKLLQWTVKLPRNFNWVTKTSARSKKKRRVPEAIVRGPTDQDVVNANRYVAHMLAASLGLKLCDAGRRILLYTKPYHDNKSFYAVCRGVFPIQELCGTMTALALAKRDLLGVEMPLWKLLLPAVVIHGMANFRGMKPIFKWNSATPWSEMQLSPFNVPDSSTLPQLLSKGFAKLMWVVILGRVLGYCVKNYYMVNRQAVKRTTTYAGKHSAFSGELATAELLKKK